MRSALVVLNAAIEMHTYTQSSVSRGCDLLAELFTYRMDVRECKFGDEEVNKDKTTCVSEAATLST